MEGVACTTQNEMIGQPTWGECSNAPPPSSETCTPNRDATASAPVLDQFEQSSTEDRGLEDRKRAIWEDMRIRMDNRRKDWNVEVDRMRKDFFGSKPAEATPAILKEPGKDDGKQVEKLRSTVCEGGSKFRVCFDVSSFLPDEICVKTEEQKLTVSARHEDKSPDGKRTATREFNRQVDIPRNMHPESMRCTLTRDGQLQVEADLDKRRLSTPSTPTTSPFHKITHWAPPSPTVSPKTTEPKMFTVSLNIGSDFEPEDLSVKTVDRKLVVSARRQILRPGNTSMSEFHREFDLPDSVDPTTVTANMTEEGLLLIEAPLLSLGHQSVQQT